MREVRGSIATLASVEKTRRVRQYRECLAEPVDGSSPEAVAALARLLEDLLPTRTDRPWRQLVSEQELVPPRGDDVLLALEDRLLNAIRKNRKFADAAGRQTLAELERLRADLLEPKD